MMRTVQRTWFEVWGTEEAQNRFLKGLLGFTISLSIVQSFALLMLSLRKPVLIAISATTTQPLTVTLPTQELLESEIRRTITNYISAHHSWEAAKIEDQMKVAASHVASQYQSRFREANAAQVKVAKEKNVSQLFYVSSLSVDSGSKTASIVGERVLLVDGLRAASQMSLRVTFDYGPRTETNPEGIYITAEDLVQPTKEK